MNVTVSGMSGIEILPSGNDSWSLYSIDGQLIRTGRGDNPDFSSLETGSLYIVKVDDKSYKYLHLK